MMDMGRRQSTIELVAIDMDGTLLDPAHKLTPRVKQAIAEARALGVHIVLTSGRPVPGLAPFLQELGIEGDDAGTAANTSSSAVRNASNPVPSTADTATAGASRNPVSASSARAWASATSTRSGARSARLITTRPC